MTRSRGKKVEAKKGPAKKATKIQKVSISSPSKSLESPRSTGRQRKVLDYKAMASGTQDEGQKAAVKRKASQEPKETSPKKVAKKAEEPKKVQVKKVPVQKQEEKEVKKAPESPKKASASSKKAKSVQKEAKSSPEKKAEKEPEMISNSTRSSRRTASPAKKAPESPKKAAEKRPKSPEKPAKKEPVKTSPRKAPVSPKKALEQVIKVKVSPKKSTESVKKAQSPNKKAPVSPKKAPVSPKKSVEKAPEPVKKAAEPVKKAQKAPVSPKKAPVSPKKSEEKAPEPVKKAAEPVKKAPVSPKKAPQSPKKSEEKAPEPVKKAPEPVKKATEPVTKVQISPQKTPVSPVKVEKSVQKTIEVSLGNSVKSEFAESQNRKVTVVVQPSEVLKVKITEEEEIRPKCGDCPGCLRRPCTECSFCKNGQKGLCIDTYCMNTDEGRKQREEAKAKYLASLSKAKANPSSLDFTPDRHLTIKEQVDMIMSQLEFKQKVRRQEETPKSPAKKVTSVPARVLPKPQKRPELKEKKVRAKHRMLAVYGSSEKALKSRRCGECEGCMRDDCGTCVACMDKPRFGGRGSKKKACLARTCRMRGPVPQGQALAVNLPEGQTYQIVGYLTADGETKQS